LTVDRKDTGAKSKPVIDAGEADFEVLVIRRSEKVPVVVDFWAPWCGPCRMLSPVLERLANEARGEWQLVKVNSDENPALASRYGVQGIPSVKAFRDGQIVAEFVGALPEPQVREFLAKLVPTQADRLAEAARGKELRGDLNAAEAGYRQALEQQSDHAGALAGLGRVLFARDRYDEAIAVLDRVPYDRPERVEAETWLAQSRFRRDSALTGGEIAARHRVAADPNDLSARLALASALAARGAYREALEGQLEVLSRDNGPYRDQARQDMLAVFSVLGDQHELTQEYRGRLATLLW
jgi:putative thioredoxin